MDIRPNELIAGIPNNSLIYIGLAFVFGAIITILVIPQIIKYSKKYHLLDKPDQRKVHKTPIPTLGGIGFFIGFIVVSTFWMFYNHEFNSMTLSLFFALIVLFITGIFDDLKDLRASLKFLIQIIVALIIAYFGFKIESLNGVFGIYEMHPVAQYAFSVFLIVGLTNAFNLIDGIDGLAGGLAFINSMVMGSILLYQDNITFGVLAITFAGSLLGFLIFNFNPAKIFMGDTGSLLVGFLMAIFGIVVIQGGFTLAASSVSHTASLTVVVVGILLLPVYDTLRVFTERILKKSSPFKPDRTHVHHLLIETGANHKKAAILLYISDIVIISLAFVLKDYNPSLSIILLFILAAVLSESINLKRLFIELAKGKQAKEETEKMTADNRFLEDIIDNSNSK
jgi:UDP-N-acetylmuramyl pentapeptide phosphotransferase/UDP-N-acetylglucosamine-1-phosphate transferase